jgi:hypothetical protein
MDSAEETTNPAPTPARPDPHDRIDDVHRRIDSLEDKLRHVWKSVEGLIERGARFVHGAAAAVAHATPAPISSAAHAVEDAAEMVEELLACPDHPDAKQTPNGCTAEGCTFSPPAR